MKGYLNDPEGNRLAFWDGGWYRSGDVGLFDADGYLYIIDRLKDMIITGGENVYSREIEEVLYTSQEVQASRQGMGRAGHGSHCPEAGKADRSAGSEGPC
jgi:acyl-CoA synthetase (AMP-forming)/AMP-acid ligase II